MDLLTKAQVLQGIKYVEELPVEELGGSVKIRALSDGEFTSIEMNYVTELLSIGIDYDELQQIRQGKLETFEPMKMSNLSLASLKRQWSICSNALSVDEQWSIEEVKRLPIEATDKIAVRTEEISKK